MMESAEQFLVRKDEEYRTSQKVIEMKDIGRKSRLIFEREAWTFLVQHNLDKKVFVIERLRKLPASGEVAYPKSWKENDIEYRIGYYIVGRIGRAKDKWVWGQFCPLIPQQDLTRLFEKAKAEGTIL